MTTTVAAPAAAKTSNLTFQEKVDAKKAGKDIEDASVFKKEGEPAEDLVGDTVSLGQYEKTKEGYSEDLTAGETIEASLAGIGKDIVEGAKSIVTEAKKGNFMPLATTGAMVGLALWFPVGTALAASIGIVASVGKFVGGAAALSEADTKEEKKAAVGQMASGGFELAGSAVALKGTTNAMKTTAGSNMQVAALDKAVGDKASYVKAFGKDIISNGKIKGSVKIDTSSLDDAALAKFNKTAAKLKVDASTMDDGVLTVDSGKGYSNIYTKIKDSKGKGKIKTGDDAKLDANIKSAQGKVDGWRAKLDELNAQIENLQADGKKPSAVLKLRKASLEKTIMLAEKGIEKLETAKAKIAKDTAAPENQYIDDDTILEEARLANENFDARNKYIDDDAVLGEAKVANEAFDDAFADRWGELRSKSTLDDAELAEAKSMSAKRHGNYKEPDSSESIGDINGLSTNADRAVKLKSDINICRGRAEILSLEAKSPGNSSRVAALAKEALDLITKADELTAQLNELPFFD